MNNLQEKVIRAMVDMYGFYSIEELSEMTEISISSIKRSLKDKIGRASCRERV